MRALVASFYAWIAAVTGLFLAFSLDCWVRDDCQVEDMLIVVALYAKPSAVVVFGTCLVVVAPLLQLLAASSKCWRPYRAAMLGAVVGPLALSLWAMLVFHSAQASSFLNAITLITAVAASLAGATFGFSYARLRQVKIGG